MKSQKLFAYLCLTVHVIHFVGVAEIIFSTTNSPEENRLSVNIWTKEKVTLYDGQGFPYCKLRDTR